MVWRRGNFFGVTFEDQSSLEPSEPDVKASDLQFDGEMLSMLSAPPMLAQIDSDRAPTEFESTVSERKREDRSDVRFAIGVAVALALPVLISLGAYVATTIALRVG